MIVADCRLQPDLIVDGAQDGLVVVDHRATDGPGASLNSDDRVG